MGRDDVVVMVVVWFMSIRKCAAGCWASVMERIEQCIWSCRWPSLACLAEDSGKCRSPKHVLDPAVVPNHRHMQQCVRLPRSQCFAFHGSMHVSWPTLCVRHSAIHRSFAWALRPTLPPGAHSVGHVAGLRRVNGHTV